MSEVEILHLPTDVDVPSLWSTAAARAAAWLRGRALPARDATLLLPFAALVPVARETFAAEPGFGGWPPRIETPLTLAAALGPPPEAAPGRVSGEPLVDRLAATARVRRLLGATGLDERAVVPGELPWLTAQFVDAAQRLRAAALALAPARRAGWWAAAAARTAAAAAGPAQLEARLLSEAVNWCAEGVAGATDRLFRHRPAAWIVVEMGGADALVAGLLDAAAAAGVPALRLVADPPSAAPFAATACPARVRRWIAEDAEDEARAAAAAVVDALAAERTPVALVALDRALVRRTRALLERAGVPLHDETGWQLSTTRAAAELRALLRAARAGSGGDAWLDWLATWPRAEPAARASLEALWRGSRRVRDAAAATRLARAAGAHLAPLAEPGRRSLNAWLQRLAGRLQADGSAERLRSDAAGAQVLAALRLDGAGPGWGPAADALHLDLAEFDAWLAAALEARTFVPPADAGAVVVVTPLARAIGRPFGAVVLPGADHRHLGDAAPAASLVGDALAAELGVPTRGEARLRQRLALAQLMRVPALTLLRRLQDEGEGFDDSPDLQWLLLERARAGLPAWPDEPAPLPRRLMPAAPVAPPRPSASAALPHTLSATQVEALRDCPYRFFARAVLRLEEPAELEQALAKRDYGEWLHLVLQHFHAGRAAAEAAAPHEAAAPPPDDAARLQQAAEHATRELRLDAAELLPFRASFEAFAPAYLRWLARHEAAGWHWLGGETEHRFAAAALAPTTLRGRLDRIDQGPGGTRRVIDYKTGSKRALERKVKEPLEDTQLAFYAALLGDATPLEACYLALDERDAPIEIAHPAVQRSAAALVAGLGDELRRLRAGAAMLALGEGEVCLHCEMRGLCRRDHWRPPAQQAAEAAPGHAA